MGFRLSLVFSLSSSGLVTETMNQLHNNAHPIINNDYDDDNILVKKDDQISELTSKFDFK